MAYTSPSKEELLASIRPDMRLTKDFFKRIYGYEISYPGFAEQAILSLETAGCSRARDYYKTWVDEYETMHETEMKKAAAWYAKKSRWEKRKKEGERERARQQQTQWQKNSRERWTKISETLGFQPMTKER